MYMSVQKIGRTDLVETLVAKHGLPKSKANEIITTLVEEIQNQVANGNSVTITGFGTFEGRAREARTGRNPKTGAELQIAASITPGFKAGSGFKTAVAKK
jgi:nucleoid DNA-binding protein